MTRIGRVLGALALAAALPAAAGAAEPADWAQQALLAWGEGPAEVGLTLPFEDELQAGPYGLAATPDGGVAVIDRVGQRALVFGPGGVLEREVALEGRPGPAAVLPDGTVVVVDEGDARRVRLAGGLSGELRSPRWALPAARLVAWSDDRGRPAVVGVDAFQLQLPLTPFEAAPRALPRGVPATDGDGAVWVVREHGETTVVFPEADVALDPALYPAGGEGFRPGGVEVLAVANGEAIVLLEAVSDGEGPIEVERAVVRVDQGGAAGPPLPLPPVGPVAIPLDVVATPDGAVWLLQSGEEGCALWWARPVSGEGVER